MPVGDVRVRRIAKMQAGSVTQAGADEFGDLTFSMLLPPYAKLAAAGKLFAVDTSGGTAKAPSATPPTTTATWGLFNASATETLVLLEVAYAIKSGTQGLGMALNVASAIGPQTAVTADYATGATAVKTCLDGTNRKPDVWIANAVTLVGGTPSWSVVANDYGAGLASVNVGSGLRAAVEGKFVARPNGGMVASVLVAPTGTSALFWVSFIFAMLELDLY